MKYLIWSVEHDMWWGANSRGYTEILSGAGIYSHRDAVRICGDANRYCMQGHVNEVMIPAQACNQENRDVIQVDI